MKSIHNNTAKVEKNQKTAKSSEKNTVDFTKMELELKSFYVNTQQNVYASLCTEVDEDFNLINKIDHDDFLFLSIISRAGNDYKEAAAFLCPDQAIKLRDFITQVLKVSGYE